MNSIFNTLSRISEIQSSIKKMNQRSANFQSFREFQEKQSEPKNNTVNSKKGPVNKDSLSSSSIESKINELSLKRNSSLNQLVANDNQGGALLGSQNNLGLDLMTQNLTTSKLEEQLKSIIKEPKIKEPKFKEPTIKEPKLTALNTKVSDGFSMKESRVNEKKYAGLIEKASKKYNVPASLIHSIIKSESNFNPDAVSPKSAMGLMQLIPETAEAMGVEKPFDPVENIDGGTKYFKQLLEEYQGNTVKALGAYNAGPDALEAKNNQVPNYPETQGYINKVLKNYMKMNGVKPQ